MRLSKFLKWKLLLPFIVIASVAASLGLWATLKASPLRFISLFPGFCGVVFFFWFYYAYGYCPKCRHHMGKNIGTSCKHCGHIYAQNDIITKDAP